MTEPRATELETRIRSARAEERTALIPFLVAGHPDRKGFAARLAAAAEFADAIEIGLPFSDPTADGPVIATASRAAARRGVNLPWLLETIAATPLAAPPILFSYLNPLLAFGIDLLFAALRRARFVGLVVPDLPFEESDELRRLGDRHGVALVQLVTPLTSTERRSAIAHVSRGFLYAVLRTGITGARTDVDGTHEFLADLRRVSPVPVCAGFGLREPRQVRALRLHADGLIVGTALVEALDRNEPPCRTLRPLLAASHRSSSTNSFQMDPPIEGTSS